MSGLAEAVVEDAALEWHSGLGYAVAHGQRFRVKRRNQ